MVNEPIHSLASNVKVVGGTEAADGEIPYQIAMLRSGSFICGGSLIGPTTVLTAAHCVYGYESQPGAFQVRYGTTDRTVGPTIVVAKVNRHAQYNSNTIDYDIATFVLSTAFTPGTNAAIVTLATAEPAAGTTVMVSGYGRLTGGGVLPTKLQKANLATVSQPDCQSRWGGNTISPRMLCAWDTTQSACNGDSGGPLTLAGVQLGVVSWGSSQCLHQVYPNVYVNVPNLFAWIQANMA